MWTTDRTTNMRKRSYGMTDIRKHIWTACANVNRLVNLCVLLLLLKINSALIHHRRLRRLRHTQSMRWMKSNRQTQNGIMCFVRAHDQNNQKQHLPIVFSFIQSLNARPSDKLTSQSSPISFPFGHFFDSITIQFLCVALRNLQSLCVCGACVNNVGFALNAAHLFIANLCVLLAVNANAMIVLFAHKCSVFDCICTWDNLNNQSGSVDCTGFEGIR